MFRELFQLSLLLDLDLKWEILFFKQRQKKKNDWEKERIIYLF